MTCEIVASRQSDVVALSEFLRAGFKAAADEPFAQPDVIAWKYFDQRGAGDGGPRSFVAIDNGRIVGHLGWCPSTFCVADQKVATLHMTDWLGSSEYGPVGAA